MFVIHFLSRRRSPPHTYILTNVHINIRSKSLKFTATNVYIHKQSHWQTFIPTDVRTQTFGITNVHALPRPSMAAPFHFIARNEPTSSSLLTRIWYGSQPRPPHATWNSHHTDIHRTTPLQITNLKWYSLLVSMTVHSKFPLVWLFDHTLGSCRPYLKQG